MFYLHVHVCVHVCGRVNIFHCRDVTVTSLTLVAVLARPAVVTAALVLVVVQRVTVAVQTRVRVTLVDR